MKQRRPNHSPRLVAVLAFVAALAFGAAPAFAQVTGKVIGTVTDRDTGQPLVGAQVVVEGTNLGNVTNEDGYYFINNVPVGVQRITAQYLGYQTQQQDQRVLAGQTMTVDFALSSEVVQAEGIVAVIEREPLVARDNVVSKSRFTGEDARDLPTENVTEVINLSAGVYSDQALGGFIVRGGRATEAATYVDGALVTNFSTQRTSSSGAGATPTGAAPVGDNAVEEIDVITGGFNAEFGHAQSGVINIVTREGGRDYSGNVRVTTDELNPEQSYGYNNLQASFGGPIVPGTLTFFGSVEATGAEDFFPSAAGFNPVGGFDVVPDADGDGVPEVVANSDGSTEDLLPGNRGDETRAQGKLTAFLPWNAKATGTYLFSRDQFENYNHAVSLNQHLTANATRTESRDVILGYDQQIFQTAERNLNLQIRANWHETDSWQGLPRTPETASIIAERIECGSECDVDESAFEDDFLNYRFGDIEFFFEDSIPGQVLNLPNQSSRLPDPVFGVPRLWISDGLFTDFIFNRNETRTGLRVDLDSQLNRVHRAKVGFEWTWIDLKTVSGNFTSSTFADVYDVSPRVGAAYVQDRLDYGDLVIDLGLRWDHWDPNTLFPALEVAGEKFYAAGIVPCEIASFENQCTETATTLDAPTRDELAPRIGVAHPITDATQVRLSYGKFYQLPELRHFYASYLTNFPGNPNITYGNPNLDFVETTAFEAGITHLLSENLVLDVVGYNRDRRGAIRLDVFQPGVIAPQISERRIFTNGDNGNVKGFDITFSKRYSNYFSTDLAWSLQWARGTTSSPTDWATGSGFGRLFDPLQPGVLLTPPSELQPEDFDRLHNINWQFQLRFPDDFQEGTTVGTIFKNFGAYVVYNAQSGQPFTRREANSRSEPQEDLGSSRLPWIHSGDIRLTKGFDLGEGLDLSVFTVIQNFLDVENVVRVHATTGRPDVSGFEREDTPNIPSDFRVEGASGLGPNSPVSLDDIRPEFQADFAKWDLDNDGFITFAEGQEILFEARRVAGIIGGTNAAVFGDDPANYGEPRQIRFGAEIRF
ncbi:MAG: carboxypeptidase-like regulatory domain-containing protein [Gemmatimonadota bacterium]|nr:carboxypeptidase-like regulatory domain-containing protein [Gemmatimonadota bacterium]